MGKYALVTDDVYEETDDAGRSPAGYWAPAVVRGVITADRLLVDLVGDGIEIDLILAGIEPNTIAVAPDPITGRRQMTPEAVKARDWVADAIEAAPGNRHFCFLPRPRHVAGWLPSIRPGSRHAGVLFLKGDAASLNSRIAANGLSKTEPECPYISPHWNRRRPAAG